MPGEDPAGRGQIAGLIGWVVICFLAGGIGALASLNAPTFYAELVRPAWAPPAAVFGPVWTFLYALMAVSGWLIWREREQLVARRALVLFVLQLAINALWSWLFFAWHLGSVSFLDIILLWGLIANTAIVFAGIRPLAAVLLVPYLAWVTFAAALNYVIWQLNPGLLGN